MAEQPSLPDRVRASEELRSILLFNLLLIQIINISLKYVRAIKFPDTNVGFVGSKRYCGGIPLYFSSSFFRTNLLGLFTDRLL
jgi:hypothetical protein